MGGYCRSIKCEEEVEEGEGGFWAAIHAVGFFVNNEYNEFLSLLLVPYSVREACEIGVGAVATTQWPCSVGVKSIGRILSEHTM